jgi:hypothetical protein
MLTRDLARESQMTWPPSRQIRRRTASETSIEAMKFECLKRGVEVKAWREGKVVCGKDAEA